MPYLRTLSSFRDGVRKLAIAKEEGMDVDEAEEAGNVNLANAVDLSESEEEEELEDIIDDFAALQTDMVRLITSCPIRAPNLHYLQDEDMRQEHPHQDEA